MLISQTCDVVLPDRLTVQLARRVQLSETAATEARAGRRPRYVHLPAVGEGAFADLEIVCTVAKVLLVGLQRVPGVATDDQTRRFSGAVARRYGRFPFPDEVTPWLRPLETIVSSRSGHPASPEGQALKQVAEFRVEATNGWRTPPYDLTLLVIVEPWTLPTFPDDELPNRPADLTGWLHRGAGARNRSAAEVADRLATATRPDDRYWLWTALGDAWAARCTPKSSDPVSVRQAVSNVVAEVVPADEFPLTRYRRSEQLDLDHLSPPAPR